MYLMLLIELYGFLAYSMSAGACREDRLPMQQEV